MGSELTTQRLIELIALSAQDPGSETDWLRDMDAAAKELLERRKAEQCQKCKGIGAPWNNSSSVPCDDCGGTGKQGNAELIAEALSDARGIVEALLEECRGSAGSERLGERIEDAEQWMRGTFETGKPVTAELIAALRESLNLIDECAADTIGTSTEIEFINAGDKIRAAISRAEGKRV